MAEVRESPAARRAALVTGIRGWAAPLLPAVASLFLAACRTGAIDQTPTPLRGPDEAGAGYWIAVGLAVAALFGFAAWALGSRRVPESIGVGTLAILVVALIGWTLVMHVLPAIAAQEAEPTRRAWDWGPGEELSDPGGSGLSGEPHRGYELYVAQNCAACHTLYLRPQDIGTGWAEGAAAEDVAATGDYVRMPSPPLGTQRNGPDLTFIGRRIPDLAYQVDHLRDPRAFKPDSIMPGYGYLSDRDLRDLAAFLVSLGNPREAIESGRASPPATAGLGPEAEMGRELYRTQGCVGCHSIDGTPNVGPTWKGLWGKEEPLAGGGTAKVDEAYLREAILEPTARVVEGYRPVMPPYEGRLTEEEVAGIITFIRALGDAPDAGAEEGGGSSGRGLPEGGAPRGGAPSPPGGHDAGGHGVAGEARDVVEP